MSKPKYSSEFKIMVAEAYLNGEGGLQYTANKYGVGVTSVQLWVRCYQHHGKSGFAKKLGNASYSSDFKQECVEAVVIEGFSINEVIAKYGIPSRSVLQRWIQVYNANRELKDYKPVRGIYMAGRKTSFEERREIVEYCISQNKDYKKAAAKFHVSYYQVYSWVKKYNADREEGLSDKRGRRKPDEEVDELERLRRENLRLKRQLEEKDMVVELLKKLKEFERM